jgi:type VI secretion system protein ImpJ
MTSAKNIPDAIQWHEGMLLTPQHFQELALRQEAMLQYSAASIAPYHWGVRRLEYDHSLLVAGKLRVVELEATMPDGGVVTQEPQWDRALELELDPHKDQIAQGAASVHLVVPVRKAGYVKGDLARYESIEGAPVVDANTGDGETRIPRLRPRASLLLSEDPPAKYVSLPLVRVRYEGESYSLVDYEPPTPFVTVGSPIHRLCKDIAERIREKAVSLSERSRSTAGVLTGSDVSGTRFAIHCLVAALPPFEAVLNTPQTHPYALYLSLCGLVGHLASLGRGLVPPALPAYDHCDLLATFQRAQRFTLQMIREGIPESHTAHTMELIKEEVFSIFVDEDWLQRQLVIELRPRPGVSVQDLIRWGEQSLIGSESRVMSLRARRVLGAKRRRVDREGDLFPMPGAVLFALSPEDDAVQPNEALQIFNTEGEMKDSQPAEIVVYVRNPS